MIHWALKIPFPNSWISGARRAATNNPELKDVCEKAVRIHMAGWLYMLVASPILLPIILFMFVVIIIIGLIDTYGRTVGNAFEWAVSPIFWPLRKLTAMKQVLVQQSYDIRQERKS